MNYQTVILYTNKKKKKEHQPWLLNNQGLCKKTEINWITY